jgi:hypothetical protein
MAKESGAPIATTLIQMGRPVTECILERLAKVSQPLTYSRYTAMDRIFMPSLGLLLSLSLAAAPLISYIRHHPASHRIVAEDSSDIIVPSDSMKKISFCDPLVGPRFASSRSNILNCEIFPFNSYERLLDPDGIIP